MAWQRYGRYYYRSERHGSHVRSVYIGYGPEVVRFAALVADATFAEGWYDTPPISANC